MQVSKINNDYSNRSNPIAFKQILRNEIPVRALKDNKYLLIVSGPSGVGKDTVMNEIISMFNKIVTHTTRPKRPDEVDGINYFFTTVEKFLEGIRNNEFVESVNYSGNYYGTHRDTIKNALKDGKPGLLIVDVKGAKTIRESLKNDPDINVVSIFFRPPSTKKLSPIDVLRKRLSRRGTETPESIEKRLSVALEEISRAGEYDAEIAFKNRKEGLKDIIELLHLNINA